MTGKSYIYHVYNESGIIDILNEIKIDDMKDFDERELRNNLTVAQKDRIYEIIQSEKILKIIVESADVYLGKTDFGESVIFRDGEKLIEAQKINSAKVREHFRNGIICETLNNLEYFSIVFQLWRSK